MYKIKDGVTIPNSPEVSYKKYNDSIYYDKIEFNELLMYGFKEQEFEENGRSQLFYKLEDTLAKSLN